MRYCLVLLITLAAAVVRADDHITCVEFLPAEIDANIKVWTPEREQKAQPMLFDAPTDKELMREFESTDFSDRLHTLLATQQQEKTVALTSLLRSGGTQSVTLSGPPFNAIGRLVIFDNTAGDKTCTAFFIEDPSIVMTAAHCVFNRLTGKFFANIFFRRAHTSSGGGEPFGFSKIAVVDEWTTSQTPHDFDYALLRASTKLNSTIRPLAFSTLGTFPDWIAVGYPSDPHNPNFDGQTMLRAAGTRVPAPSTNMIRMDGNPMGPGSSGGPFLPPASPPQNAFGTGVISVASQKMTPTTVDGPILGQRTKDLFANVKNVSGDCQK